MKVGNLAGRVVLIGDSNTYLDVAEASNGRFGPSPASAYERWDDFLAWASTVNVSATSTFDAADLGTPVPTPRQIFAVGLNYSDHASESGFSVPEQPTVFTKFVSCLAGPQAQVPLPADGNTDWEVELVAVIGQVASNVTAEDAWAHVAGLTVGQDISERKTQSAGPVPQFSLGKSFPAFGPVGPWVVPIGEFSDPDDLELGCSINGKEMQRGRTKDLIFSIPELVSRLSHIVTLYPGDLIFSGTPAGVGLGRDPQVWLQDGDRLVSWVEGIGELRNHCVARRSSEDGDAA